MLKSLFFLVGDGANRASPATSGGPARPLRDQQLIKWAEAVGWAQKALVMAVAQNRARRERDGKFSARIVELEAHAASAQDAGNEDAAIDAAEAVAWLESAREREAAALSGFAEEFTKLRRLLRIAKVRLKARQQGCGAIDGNDAVWWRRDQGPSDAHESDQESFGAAEKELARLYRRQAEFDHVNAALDRLDGETDPGAITRMMAAAGFAAPTPDKAREVRARLRSGH